MFDLQVMFVDTDRKLKYLTSCALACFLWAGNAQELLGGTLFACWGLNGFEEIFTVPI